MLKRRMKKNKKSTCRGIWWGVSGMRRHAIARHRVWVLLGEPTWGTRWALRRRRLPLGILGRLAGHRLFRLTQLLQLHTKLHKQSLQ